MYIRFNNVPGIISENGEAINSVNDWVHFLFNFKNLSITTIDRYVSSLSKFYEYQSYFSKIELDSSKKVIEYLYDFFETIKEGNSNLNSQPISRSSINILQNALYSYLAFDSGKDDLKLSEPFNRFSIYYKKYSLLGFLKPSLNFKRNKRLTIRLPHYFRTSAKTIKYFPPELFWEFISKLKKHRDKAFFLLCAGTGARIGQALNLWQKDIFFDTGKVEFIDPRIEKRHIELKKNYFLKPDREINNKGIHPGIWLPGPIKDEFFRQAILYFRKEYIPITRRYKPHPYFFITRSGARIRPQNVRRIFKDIANKLGHPELTPHSLRHLYGYICAFCLKCRAEEIADYLGHSNTESTRVYTKIPSPEQEQIFKTNLKEFLSSKKKPTEREFKIIKYFKC